MIEECVMIEFVVNSRMVQFEGDPQTPLLWVLRDHARLTGTKFGCGIGQCGACTVHVDGQLQRSCLAPIASVAGKSVTTIEGIAQKVNGILELSPVQKAWIEMDGISGASSRSLSYSSRDFMINSTTFPLCFTSSDNSMSIDL